MSEIKIQSVRIRPDTLYIVNIPVGAMSPERARKYLNKIKETGAFDLLDSDEDNRSMVLHGYRSDGGSVEVIATSIEESDTVQEEVVEISTVLEDDPTVGYETPELEPLVGMESVSEESDKPVELEFTRENWDEAVRGIFEIENITEKHSQYKVLTQLLENEYKYLESSPLPTRGMWEVIIPLVIKVVLESKLFSSVPVVPLPGPVGYVNANDLREYNPCTDSDELSNASEYLITNMSGLIRGNKYSVQAVTAQLNAGWTLESMQDVETMYQLDIKAELVRALSQELIEQFDSMLLDSEMKCFCPWLLIIPSPVVIDASTLQPAIQIGTRFGKIDNNTKVTEVKE